jgi:uncharacterized protein (DUF2384 family)
MTQEDYVLPKVQSLLSEMEGEEKAKALEVWEETTEIGFRMWGSEERFYAWINTEIPALDNHKPIDLIVEKGLVGFKIVTETVHCIAHGIPM